MRLDADGERLARVAGVLLRPHVAHLVGAAIERPEAIPVDGEVGRGAGGVQRAHGPIATAEGLDPNLDVLRRLGERAEALFAELVLVDGDDVLVGENRADLGLHVRDVVAGHEGRGEHAPEGKMRARLGEREAAVADFKHVGIVPVAGTGELVEAVGADVVDKTVLEIEEPLPAGFPAFATIVGVVDVTGGAPEMADVGGPLPRLVLAPLADRKNHRPAGGEERVAHARVGIPGVRVAMVAPVVFQIVDAPRGEEPRVLELVAPTAGIIAAGARAGAG